MNEQYTSNGSGRFVPIALLKQVQDLLQEGRDLSTEQMAMIHALRQDRDDLRTLLLELSDILTACKDAGTVEASERAIRAYYEKAVKRG